MLSIHGIVKITRAEPLVDLGKSWVLNLQLITSQRNGFTGENRIDQYDACMFISDKTLAEDWAAELTEDRVVDIRWATLEGLQFGPSGTKGRVKVRLSADIRHTIPK